MTRLLAALVLLLAPAWGPAEAADTAENTAGKLLIANEKMPDPRFAKSVIFMVRHDDSGAFGLIVNKPLGDIPLDVLFERMHLKPEAPPSSDQGIRAWYGGPVERGKAFVLHSPDYAGKETEQVNGTAALTRDSQVLRDIAAGKGPRQVRFAFGYSGWAPGQLERELKSGDWDVVPAEPEIVFGDWEQAWQAAAGKRGVNL